MKYFWGVACLLLTTLVWAHGAGFERVPDGDTVALRFSHALGQPMAGARITVTTPDEQNFQRGQSDADGQFAFVPDRPGTWAVIADDGLGHEVRAEVEVGGVSDSNAGSTAISVSPHVLLYALLGSLAVNAGLLSILLAGRRK